MPSGHSSKANNKTATMSNREAILQHLSDVLVRNFEIAPADITPQAKLYEDLDLDSIDAVDLVVQVQDLIGRKIQPDEFKTARTVEDILNIVCRHLEG